MILPPEAHPLVQSIVFTFTSPTYQRSSALLAAALTTGRRTAADLVRTLRHLAPGHPTDHQRALSRAPWSGIAPGCPPARSLLRHPLPDGTVTPVGGDTVGGHEGEHARGRARHRDPVRSSRAHTARRRGHRWVVPAVPVRFPSAAPPWALPVLVDPYRPEEDNRQRNRPHRPPGSCAGPRGWC